MERVESLLCIPSKEAVIDIHGQIPGSNLDKSVPIALGRVVVAVVEGVLRIGLGHVVRFDGNAAIPIDHHVGEIHAAYRFTRGTTSSAIAIPACFSVADQIDIGCAKDIAAGFVEFASKKAAT